MTSRRIYTIGHVDHGKTMLAAAITLLLARPAAPDAVSSDPQPGTQDRNAGRSETQSGSSNEGVRG